MCVCVYTQCSRIRDLSAYNKRVSMGAERARNDGLRLLPCIYVPLSRLALAGAAAAVELSGALAACMLYIR